MDAHYRLEERSWDREKHLRHIDEGEWLPMYDSDGRVLYGISGKAGVADTKPDGTEIGADFIRMYPGSKFDLHIHEGDHEIFFISGEGFVHINGEDVAVSAGHLIHIPGEYPHGVWVSDKATEPLIFVPVGHPHKHIHAHDRMSHPHGHHHGHDHHDH